MLINKLNPLQQCKGFLLLPPPKIRRPGMRKILERIAERTDGGVTHFKCNIADGFLGFQDQLNIRIW